MKKSISLQIAKVISFLHTKMIFHRDIKAENILVFSVDFQSEKIQVKVTDFGISKRFEQNSEISHHNASSPPSEIDAVQTTTVGTIPWMSPEFIETKIFT